MSARLTHPRFGLDYAWTTISPQAHKSVGSSFAARYLSPDASKNLSRSEADGLRKNGIDVIVVWESSQYRSQQGHDAGVADAQAAIGQAAAVGIPHGRPIYFAVDYDTAGNPGQVDGYFGGVKSVLTAALTGVYGGKEVVTHLLNAGIGYAWQTYAWSGGNLDSRAQVFQYSNDHIVAGSSCDFNHAYFEDFGQFDYHVVPVVDYSIFPSGNVSIKDPADGRVYKLDERGRVQKFDTFFAHRHLHPGLFHQLKHDLNLLHRNIWVAANWDAKNHRWRPKGTAEWNVNNRGRRWQAIVERENKIK